MKLIRTHLKKINKPFVKSIKSPDGDIIDCVPFHLQPAFDLPELKSRVLLNSPPEPLNGHSRTRMESSLKQKWSSNGESCPRGTIPIRRTSEDEVLRSGSISRFGKKSNTRSMKNSKEKGLHEYAIGYARGEYYGLNTTLNVWAPKVAPKGFSLSQIWLAADDSTDDLNTIEAGWQVYPSLYGNDAPRLFIFWTSENYKNGCYNLICSGFVQTNNHVALGGAIQPISTYNGPQYDIKLLIWKIFQI
ncbi:hypothetical protein OSB04_018587 [Centaurea solstitialis]|uniref:Neprosin PEP catalytic domain-containing protein n=1 Tax=Centaurea solstitialis TaxID=347529 RepID=A0AA38WAN0_9ASTR|nr:hypothetical protein OSB04_018587 [Centaurea solstitialis]